MLFPNKIKMMEFEYSHFEVNKKGAIIYFTKAANRGSRSKIFLRGLLEKIPGLVSRLYGIYSKQKYLTGL